MFEHFYLILKKNYLTNLSSFLISVHRYASVDTFKSSVALPVPKMAFLGHFWLFLAILMDRRKIRGHILNQRVDTLP